MIESGRNWNLCDLGVGKYRSQGSSVLIMAILGVAVVPLLQGLIADISIEDNWGYQYSTEENPAFMKPCVQSNIHGFIRDKRAYTRAEIAVDGVTEGNTMMEQTSWTLEEEKPWWRVDLGAMHTVNEITIYNRTDADVIQLKDFTVTLHDAAGNVVWQSVQSEAPILSVTIPVSGIDVRFLKIQLNGKGALALAEVIVK